MTTIKVRFQDVEGFLTELAQEGEVEDGIVRVTHSYKQDELISFQRHTSLVAGFIAHGKLVYVEEYCGYIIHREPEDPLSQETQGRLAERARMIEEAAHARGFGLRRGRFEV